MQGKTVRTISEERLLSICIPTHDRAAAVASNVAKCLSYDIDWMDVVVTGDAPTAEVRETLARVDSPRFHFCENETQLGYANLAQSLYNGDGKYCMLLGDVDTILQADWERVKAQLQQNETVGLFIADYYDEQGNILENCRDGFLAADSVNIYNFAVRCTAWSGALIVNRDLLHKVWDDIDKSTLIWHFYSQSVSALHMARWASLARLDGLNVLRDTKRKISRLPMATDATFVCWNMHSRKRQITDWIRELHCAVGNCEGRMDDMVKRSIVLRNYTFITNYFASLHLHTSAYCDELIKHQPRLFETDMQMDFEGGCRWVEESGAELRKHVLQVFGYLPQGYDAANEFYKNEAVKRIKMLDEIRKVIG